MYSKFLHTIEKHGMLTPNSKVLVALSGGADSVLMLRLLCRYREDFGLNIRAAHLNHCLRGEESLRDESFVKSLCETLNVPLEIKRVDIHAECEKTGEGCEECGRRIRYEFFNTLVGDGVIATAHNLDDRVETLIMNIIRGTTLNGLCSISPKRDNIIRPLIDISKKDICIYCEKMGYDFVTDSSNLTDIYRRNQIRHNILPYLFDTNPSFDKSAQRMFEALDTDNDYLLSLAQNELEKCKIGENIYSAEMLKNIHPAILNRVLILASKGAKAHPENLHIDMIREILSQKGKINLPGNIFVICDGKSLKFEKNSLIEIHEKDEITEIKATVGENRLFGKKIVLKQGSLGQDNYCKKVHNMLSYNLLDCDKIQGELFLRNRREGDKISLPKRKITKSLKKLYSEEGLSKEERNTNILLCDSLGVIFVEGFGITKRVAISESTKNILEIEIFQSEEQKNGGAY